MTTTSSVAGSLASALGVSSGIDTTSLVSDLVAATRQPREALITGNQTKNDARISALASAKNSLKTFSDALTQLLQTSDYSGQPVSNDQSIATVSAVTGGTPSGLPAQLDVRQLASSQVLQSMTLNGDASVAGKGTLSITVGTTTTDITLSDDVNTLKELAQAINDKKIGVTASIMTDKSGARLVLKGATGADNAFTISAGADADDDLKRFVYSGTDTGTMAKKQSAQDAIIRIDNVEMNFASNTVTTAIPFLRIDLNKAAPGTLVTLATNQPTATMASLVQDYVSAYNTLKTALNTATAPGTDTTSAGPLAGDSGIRDMVNRLSRLTNVQLATSGTYQTLADLGVSTNRDGTLSVDTVALQNAITADPAGVTQMLNPTVSDADHLGLAGALKSVTDYLNATDGPLASSATTYDNVKTSLAAQLTKLNTDMSNYQDRLSTQFNNMQTQLIAFKATQSYLTQQINAWNNKN